MRDGSFVSLLQLVGLFGAALAFACGSDGLHAHPSPAPCGAEECAPLGGNGGSTDGDDDDGGSGGADDDGGSYGGSAGGGDSGEGGSGGAPMPPLELERRVGEAVENIESDTCFAGDDTSLCEWADYEVGAAQFDMPRSTGEAVLVIDEFGAGFYPELVRYRNRLRGFYRVRGEGVEPQILSVHLPRRLGEVLVSFAGPEFIPARALTRVGSVASAVYGKLNLLYYGHGGVVFAHAVELLPEQPLVLLDLTQFLDMPAAACAGIDGPMLAAARAHFAAIADSLKRVMIEQNVRFINASFGSTVPNLATDWTRTCASEVPNGEQLQALLHVYDPIYDLLFNSEGVLTAQAAANLGNPADFPFDQISSKYPNRVRVGFISSQRSGLDELGRGTVQMAERFPLLGDADVYLNWGCEGVFAPSCAEPHYEFAGPFGLGTSTVPLMSSSYVDPLAVARLVNLRYARHASEPMSNGLIQTLRQELTPALCGDGGAEPCVHQDPFAHRQLEPYRLGYE